MIKAKPFIKWVGGKTQLLEQLEANLPADFDKKEITYIEPFVGGGAMLFHMLQKHHNIKKAFINDINEDLIIAYQTVKNSSKDLITSLKNIQEEYYVIKNEEKRREYFLEMRKRYNTKSLDFIENTTLFIFLNRTCFNGLYRVNKSGLFNVPFGKYTNPTICDEETIIADSELLKNVEILSGDFENTIELAEKNSFYYFDPPYRPLSNTSSFNDYTKEAFNDVAQKRLKLYCDKLSEHGALLMLSNSDCKGKNPNDTFFNDLYNTYHVSTVWASRNINANASKRGKLTELLIRNYENTQHSKNSKTLFEPKMGTEYYEQSTYRKTI